MDIVTHNSPTISQKPYTSPLTHAAGVQKELELLEKATIVVRSVSPWASYMVVMPKNHNQVNPIEEDYVLTIEH